MNISTFLRANVLAALLVAATSGASNADEHVNGPAPGHGPYMVFAHYMPCFPAFGYSPHNNYWYNAQYSPEPNAKGGLTSRPIIYPPDPANPELSATVAEIRIAKQYGIDGFLVDELWDGDSGSGLGYRQEWQRLLKAAEIAGGFYIGLMPDYATLKPSTIRPDARNQIKAWVDIGMKSPAFLRYDGKPVVFPYGAAFPDGRYKEKDNELICEAEKRDLVDWFAAQGTPISYAPSIGVDARTYDVPYSKDPDKGFQTYAFAVGSFTPTAPNKYYQKMLDYWPPTLMAMAENAFIYYNRGWNYCTGRMDLSAYYRQHWDWNIANRDRYRWVMLVTWNDWGETSIAPSVNHLMAWQPVTRYYSDWFKTGRQPKITTDSIEIFHRPHPYAAKPTTVDFTVDQIKDFQITTPNDVVEALGFLTRPATLVIQSGDKVFKKAVPAGLQSLVEPFSPGVQSAQIERNGKLVATVTSAVPITEHPGRQNLWYIGADSLHPARPLASTAWTDVSGAWTGNGASRMGQGLSLTGDPILQGDISLSAIVTLKNATDGSAAGLVAHSTADGATFYRFCIARSGDQCEWRLERVLGGVATVLDHGPASIGANHPNTMRLDIVGEYHIAYLDGKLVAQVSDWPDWKDNKQRAFGQSGVWAIGTTAEFKQIGLRSYDPAEW